MKGKSLEEEVGSLLLSLGLTIAVAESCTGGLICHRLTNVSGSSNYLDMGVVTYSNRAKIATLGVPEAVIAQHGAVSTACVKAMAMGVKTVAGTNVGLAVSGIAGPTGGSSEKPVGTVHVALADGEKVEAWRYLFEGDRIGIKMQTAEEALRRLRDHCLGCAHG